MPRTPRPPCPPPCPGRPAGPGTPSGSRRSPARGLLLAGGLALTAVLLAPPPLALAEAKTEAKPEAAAQAPPQTVLRFGGTVKPEDLRLAPAELTRLTEAVRLYDQKLKEITVLMQRLEDIPPLSRPPKKADPGQLAAPEALLVVGVVLETLEGVKLMPNRLRIPRKDLLAKVLELIAREMAAYEKLRETPGFKDVNVKRIYF